MKISIVGTGRVGSAIAFAVVLKRLADQLVLVGRGPESAVGDAMDLEHASAFNQQIDVRSGGVEATAGSDVVVLAAAAPLRSRAEDRLLAADDNARLFADLVPRLTRHCPGAIFLVVTNPVDLMTYLTLQHCRAALGDMPVGRVFGTGTLIDTARFRTLLSEYVGVHTHDIRAYILGEHGDSQFAAMAVASAGGQSLDARDPHYAKMADQARDEGHRVFRAKGFTNYGIAAAAAMVLEAIATNSRSVFPVSTLLEDYHGVSDVCLSVPGVIGRGGLIKTLKVDLSPDEVEKLRHSAGVMKKVIAEVSA